MSTDLDTLAAQVDAATPGPWRDVPMGSEGSVVIAGGNTITTARKPATCREFADAEFIAAARNALPDLLAELAAARAALARCWGLADHAESEGYAIKPDELRASVHGVWRVGSGS